MCLCKQRLIIFHHVWNLYSVMSCSCLQKKVAPLKRINQGQGLTPVHQSTGDFPNSVPFVATFYCSRMKVVCTHVSMEG